MKGKPQSTGVGDLRFRTVVQLNPLSLPARKHGENHVRLFAGEQVETITIDPDLSTPAYREVVFSETNVVTAREQLQAAWVSGLCAKEPDTPCELVYKVSAPGEIRQVRWGGRFRADTDCLNEMYYSTDGKQWRRRPWTNRWTKPDSPVPNLYVAVNETTKDVTGSTVFLKYRFQRPKPQKDRGVLHLVSALRIDVDYVPPGGVGAVPVEIAYCWAEAVDGKHVEKTHTERVTTLPHDWRITVDGNDKPLMKWVRMRLVSP